VTTGAVLAIIGGGNMGCAVVQGLLRAGHAASDLVIVETSAERRAEITKLFAGIHIAADTPRCDDAIIAVKPADVATACARVVAAGAQRVISIAAGVRIAAIQSACGAHVRVIRAMPNTPAVVGLSATAMAVSHTCDDADRAWARTLLQSIGIVVEIDESMLDAFTGLIGSGPAYVFYVAESLQAAAVAEGFEEVTSAKLVAQLLVGAAALLEREPQHARELRQRVTSPNGTTAAGVAALNDRKTHDAFIAAVRAATQRSKELGDA
jgi:pyrroline-5-carboxylate reductase